MYSFFINIDLLLLGLAWTHQTKNIMFLLHNHLNNRMNKHSS
uniref:Uncharacterized protein n=1 Tax=Arundo donax TaxID=35708 RepID=A0A0A9C1W7_ARUDO